jgi:hypothetical protein
MDDLVAPTGEEPLRTQRQGSSEGPEHRITEHLGVSDKATSESYDDVADRLPRHLIEARAVLAADARSEPRSGRCSRNAGWRRSARSSTAISVA